MKKLFAILCLFALSAGLFALPAGALPENPVDRKFAGAVSRLTAANWSEDYFSAISFRIGEDKLLLDGGERPMSPAVWEDGEPLMPVVDIAHAVGAGVSIDMKTGEIALTDDGRRTVVVQPIEKETPTRKHGGVKRFAVYADGTVEGVYADGARLFRRPRASAGLLEEALHVDVRVEKDRVTITKPLQLKQLVVQTKDGGPVRDTLGAVEWVTGRSGLCLLRYGSIRAAEAALEKFRGGGGLEFAAPNKLVRAESISWGTERIRAGLFKAKLISENKTLKNIDVALVDSGVDASHPFLAGRLDAGYDFVGNDSVPEDVLGHGTHVAGTLADCSTSNVKIMPVKALDDDGEGTYLAVYLGIRYAADLGARVINMSFDAYEEDPDNLVARAVNYAAGKGCVCVASAGNESRDVRDICPANLANTIAVAASDMSDLPAGFSNYGDGLDIAAPGVNIYSCVPHGGYAAKSGTSMAAPHVSASAAMLLLNDPSVTPGNIRAALKGVARDMGSHAAYGAGIVDFSVYFANMGVTAEEYIELPFINGYPGGVFKPDAGISRAEAVQIIFNILGPGANADLGRLSGFSDISASHWAARAFAWAVGQGYVNGGGDGRLRPDDSITRAELSAILNRVLQKENLLSGTNSASTNFTDTGGHWAYGDIAALAGKGIIMGYGDGTFRPENNVTRAETVAMTARLFSRTKDFRPNTIFGDVPQSHWAYGYIMNAVNGHAVLLYKGAAA